MNPIFSAPIEVIFLIVIIASMITMFTSELMSTVPLITSFKNEKIRDNLLKYIIPAWEVVGTFFVLWLVDMETVVPFFAPPMAYTLFPLFAIFIFFLIVRNATIIYAEFIWKDNRLFDDRKLYTFYAIATFIMGLMALSVITVMLSGYVAVINISKPALSSLNYSVLLSKIQLYGFIIGTLILLSGMGMVFYRTVDINTSKRFLPLILVIIGLIIDSFTYLSLISADHSVNKDLIVIPIVLTLIIPILFSIKKTTYVASYKPLYIIFTIVSVTFLELIVYPYVYGGKVYVPNVVTNSAVLTMDFYISVGGGIWLILMMIYYGFVSNHRIAKIMAEAKN